jgi:hypothetical protein
MGRLTPSLLVLVLYLVHVVSQSSIVPITSWDDLVGKIGAQAQGSNVAYTLAAGFSMGTHFQTLVVPSGVTVSIIGSPISSGGAHILDAGKQGRLIENHGELTLHGLTLQNGNAGDRGYGGAVQNSGVFAAYNCVFDSNEANGENGQGGAVYSGGKSATLVGCVFNNNQAYNFGGAVTVTSPVYFHACTFNGNTAGDEGVYDGGGAIFVWSGTAHVSSDCSFRPGQDQYDDIARCVPGQIPGQSCEGDPSGWLVIFECPADTSGKAVALPLSASGLSAPNLPPQTMKNVAQCSGGPPPGPPRRQPLSLLSPLPRLRHLLPSLRSTLPTPLSTTNGLLASLRTSQSTTRAIFLEQSFSC